MAEISVEPTSATPSYSHRLVSSGSRIKELDGLRGLASISVLLSHYFGEVEHALPGFAAGWLGVDLFFVLSGFLIGSIILENKDCKNFAYAFYTRRAFRIIPIYAITVCAVLFTLRLMTNLNWLEPPFSSLYYATFTQNIAMAASGKRGA